jgi:hypothetical protein
VFSGRSAAGNEMVLFDICSLSEPSTYLHGLLLWLRAKGRREMRSAVFRYLGSTEVVPTSDPGYSQKLQVVVLRTAPREYCTATGTPLRSG